MKEYIHIYRAIVKGDAVSDSLLLLRCQSCRLPVCFLKQVYYAPSLTATFLVIAAASLPACPHGLCLCCLL